MALHLRHIPPCLTTLEYRQWEGYKAMQCAVWLSRGEGDGFQTAQEGFYRIIRNRRRFRSLGSLGRASGLDERGTILLPLPGGLGGQFFLTVG